jgi:hypothetical protein
MDYPSVIVAWAVNISELSVKYRRKLSVGNVNGTNRRNNSVGDCGMGSNVLQLSVKYQRLHSICKAVGIYLRIF